MFFQSFQAIENVLVIGKQFPINTSGSNNLSYECACFFNDTIEKKHPEMANWTAVNKTACIVRKMEFFISEFPKRVRKYDDIHIIVL